MRPGPIPLPRLLSWGTSQLRAAGKGEHEARLLLQWALGVDSLLKAPNPVGARGAERYRSAISQRRAGFPLQHITGQMHYRGLDLEAGPGVFAVRPETELIPEYARGHLHGSVVDLCSGSGAIGLAVAAENPGVRVIGVELSPVAVSYGRRNKAKVKLAPGSSYSLVQGDATGALPELDGTVEAVLTNPPYVPGTPPVRGDVLYDPEIALYGGGEDGLVLPRGLVMRAHQLLRPGGVLVMEHAETQAEALVQAALESGFTEAQTLADLTERPRFLRAWKAKS